LHLSGIEKSMITLTKGALLLMLAMAAAVPAEAIEVTMDIFIENPLQPIFHGATNLPDGSELMLTLSRPETLYMAQAKMSVVGGHFTTERFSAEQHSLNAGRYKIEISMSTAQLQPEQVQAVIGDQGQRMTGKFVIPGFGGVMFDYVTERQLGGPANAPLDATAKAQVIADLRRWLVKSCTSKVDFVNAAVQSGMVTGRQILGPERQAKIDACTADAASRSIQ
jgi:hypothetical protein